MDPAVKVKDADRGADGQSGPGADEHVRVEVITGQDSMQSHLTGPPTNTSGHRFTEQPDGDRSDPRVPHRRGRHTPSLRDAEHLTRLAPQIAYTLAITWFPVVVLSLVNE